MGLFDNRLISPFIPKIFQPESGVKEELGKLYQFEQQAGCGVKIYPNSGDSRQVRQLYYQIESCSVDRSTTQIAHSFSLVLRGTEPFDETILPDDFIRIFMGDQIAHQFVSPGAYNFASGELQQGRKEKLKTSDKFGIVYVPIPGLGPVPKGGVSTPGDAKKLAYLIMYERLFGKIDRIEKLKSHPSKDGGSVPRYQVSGRSIGGIIEDISLYYNEWLPGLNAWNVFYETDVDLIASPDQFVKEIMAIVLSAVPLPQWQLPKSLIDDMNYGDILQENRDFAEGKLAKFRQRIAQLQESPKNENEVQALVELQRLSQETANSAGQSAYSVLSTLGINKCYGQTLNKSFLNSTTTGLYDLLKHLSNDAFNELYIDMCPGGNPDGGPTNSDVSVPTIVMRQRPYNITKTMLTNVSDYVRDAILKPSSSDGDRAKSLLEKFSPVEVSGISNDLNSLLKNGIDVFGPLQQSVVRYASDFPEMFVSGEYQPMLLDYQVGKSSHDRLNAFLVTGAYNRGFQNQTDRIILSENGGFLVDTDSVRRYGFRIMELSTQYAQPIDSKDGINGAVEIVPYQEVLKNFSKTLANWYFLNHVFLNGRLVCRFLPEARLGIPCRYYETRLTPDNPYPKMEMFYVQGVADNYQYGAPLTTTLTVIRGIRYNIGKKPSLVVSEAFDKLKELRQRATGVLGGVLA